METMYSSFAQRTVGDVVAEDYLRASVFKHYGIDFCCGGGKTVQAACEAKGVAYDELEEALRTVGQQRGAAYQVDPRNWDLGFLADYIVNVHHSYVRESLPVLLAFSGKVARVHGNAAPETVEIARLIEELAAEMTQHMQKEEQVLFPYVKALAAAQAARTSVARPAFGTARNPIQMMEHEHDHAGALMREVRSLSQGFVPPEWACNTFRALYAKLEEFEEDLHRHVHLENNLLFPRVLALEEQVN